jgi:hypothetical protein
MKELDLGAIATEEWQKAFEIKSLNGNNNIERLSINRKSWN